MKLYNLVNKAVSKLNGSQIRFFGLAVRNCGQLALLHHVGLKLTLILRKVIRNLH